MEYAKSAPIMALNETGTSTTGRASVRVPQEIIVLSLLLAHMI